MASGFFDGDSFFAALDGQRQAKGLTWKAVAQKSGVSASTLTRLAQGRRPDVDSLAALCAWVGMSAEKFVRVESDHRHEAEPLAQISALLRADSNLSKESAIALETVLKAAYDRLRKGPAD